MSVHQILCLTIKILRNEDFAKSRGGVAFAESRFDRKISGNEDFANCAASGMISGVPAQHPVCRVKLFLEKTLYSIHGKCYNASK